MLFFFQTLPTEEGLQRVLKGRFSYVRNYFLARILTQTYFVEGTKQVPFHISATKYPLYFGNSWAFRYIRIY